MIKKRPNLCLFIRSVTFVVTLFIFTITTPAHITFHPSLQQLLRDMQYYKLDSQGDPYLHGGDLYEHSIWTYNAMVELLHSDSPYVQGLQLTEREQEVIALAALLHDIGKAGRQELFEHTHPQLRYDILRNNDNSVAYIRYYQDRQEHPLISFAYAIGQQLYHAVNERQNSFYTIHVPTLLHDLGVTSEERQKIAILLGIHYEFGNLKHNKITQEQFLEKLSILAQKVGYHDGIIDEQLVRLAILIQVADVKGLMPVPTQKTPLFPEGISATQIHSPTKFHDTFAALGYTCGCCDDTPVAVTTMKKLLAYFNREMPCDESASLSKPGLYTIPAIPI